MTGSCRCSRVAKADRNHRAKVPATVFPLGSSTRTRLQERLPEARVIEKSRNANVACRAAAAEGGRPPEKSQQPPIQRRNPETVVTRMTAVTAVTGA